MAARTYVSLGVITLLAALGLAARIAFSGGPEAVFSIAFIAFTAGVFIGRARESSSPTA